MIIIFIAGASASGKTSFSHKLLQALKAAEKSVELMVMDSYFKEIPEGREITEYRANTNFDRVGMYDMNLLLTDVLALNSGISIPKYNFEFNTNKRNADGYISPPEFLIIEGLFAMHVARKLSDEIQKFKVFVGTSSYKSILERRVTRDAETRGRTRAETIGCEKKFVGIAYFHNIATGMRGVDVNVINDDRVEGERDPLDLGVDEVLAGLGIANQMITTPDLLIADNSNADYGTIKSTLH